MKINSFEEIISWQKGQELALLIYGLFKSNKDYGFRDQLQRSAVSVSNNIAEGFERKSNNEFRYFLFIAKGSCAEVRSMSYLASKLDYIDKRNLDIINSLCFEISKLISGLVKTL